MTGQAGDWMKDTARFCEEHNRKLKSIIGGLEDRADTICDEYVPDDDGDDDP
jgi:hypothetical protein